MTSEARLQAWCEMIMAHDSDVQFELGLKKGAVWDTKPPYPDLEVVETKDMHVRRIVMQESMLRARMPETDDEGYIKVSRLVAELENGQELELNRTAEPASDDSPDEPDNICRACDLQIVDDSEVVMHEGKPYHRRCMS